MAWASTFLDVVQCQKTFVKILPGNVLNGKIYDFSISRVPLVNCAGQGMSYTSVIYFIQERLCKVSLHFGCKDMISTYEGTSLYNKPRGQVSSCELAMFALKSKWVLRLVPRIQRSLNFRDKSLWLVPRKASCELFVGQVPENNLFV